MAIKIIYTDDQEDNYQLEVFKNGFDQCSISITDNDADHDNNIQIISLNKESLENLIEQLEDIKNAI